MRIRWLGWAGVEIEAQGERVVIDPLQDAAAVFAWLGERARAIQAPRGRPRPARGDRRPPHPPAPRSRRRRRARRGSARRSDRVRAGRLRRRERRPAGGRPGRPRADRRRTSPAASRGVDQHHSRAVHAHRAARRRRDGRSAGVLAARGRRQAGACTSATPCGTAGGGASASDTDRPMSSSPRSTAPDSRSRTASQPAHCPA